MKEYEVDKIKEDQNKIREKLFSLKNEKHQKFSSKLLPGIDNILGIPLPKLREIAKSIAKKDWVYYLSIAEGKYFEEIMLEGLVIGYLDEDFHTISRLIENFLPKINNWSVCDSFCSTLKIAEKYPDEMWDFIQPYFQSKDTYLVRFALVMLLNYYVKEEYIDRSFNIFNSTKNEEYYVEMALGWAISYFYIGFPKETEVFLRNNNLTSSAHNKAIQKIVESNRVDSQSKNSVKKLKKI